MKILHILSPTYIHFTSSYLELLRKLHLHLTVILIMYILYQ
jgi:hypothetical protein